MLDKFFNKYIPCQDFEIVQNGSVKERGLCCKGVKLSKTQIPTTTENRKENESHSLCLSHRFYKVCYAMYQTYCIPCSEFGKRVQ